MSQPAADELSPLSPAASRLGAAFARPKVIAGACVVALAGLGWLYLGLLVAGVGSLDALCKPLLGLTPQGVWNLSGVALVALMWGAMTLAMMLPSAAPMILTYAEISDTAARKGEPIVSPFVLAGGYTAAWFGFAAVATIAQLAFSRAALIDLNLAATSGLFSGAIFIAAGLYQFSALKHACLRQCQQPFPFFFANWSTTTRGVFRLGLRQGFYCVGCCWAMMLLMFAVGVMNVIWMAALGMVMTIEKIGSGRRFSHVVGVVLIAAGIAFVISATQWPTVVI